MGNQEIKSAMSRIQERGFDTANLTEFEAKLWREQSIDALSGFQRHLNCESVEKSEIDGDEKRYHDKAMDCWQTGFTNTEKRIESLKHGEYKQVLIPNNKDACDFEITMQYKISILTGMFFIRHQGRNEAIKDSFWTFARKYIQEQASSYVYESELYSTQLVNPETLQTILKANPSVLTNTVKRLLDASQKLAPRECFSTEAKGFQEDLVYMQLRRILVKFIEHADDEARELTLKLLLRWGLIRSSAEDLLIAAQLTQRYNVDISNELEYICNQSEVFVKPMSENEGDFSRTEESTIQSRISHPRGSDRAYEKDQAATDGSHWYIFSDQRGFTKGTKAESSGEWSAIHQTDDTNWTEMKMLCHKNSLYVRHKDAPDVPFQKFDKETLKPIADQEPIKVPEGCENDYLKWTPLDTLYEENEVEGNRWHRASPMYSDGENIYMLVQYRRKGHDSRIVKTVLEVYEFSEATHTMKRIHEQPLFKNDQGTYYKGSSKDISGGHLAQGSSMACNQQVLLWWTRYNFHVYEYATGIRKKKEHINSTAYITCYDKKENYYYYMDCACQSWLKRTRISGFKPEVIKKVDNSNPDLPLVFDTQKSAILAQIEQEEKLNAQQDEEVRYKKNDPRTDIFDLLSRQDDEMLDNFAPQREERKRHTEPIVNVTEICQAIIFSKMSTDAQAISFKIENLGEKELVDEEMLPYYKSPFAINLSKSYFVQIRQALTEHIAKLNEGKITTIKQSNVLNLMQIYAANIAATKVCRIDLLHMLPESEQQLINDFQFNELDSLKLLEGQKDKSNDELTPEEIIQLYIVEVSNKLSKTLKSIFDIETQDEKLASVLKNLPKAMADEECKEAKIVQKLLPLLSTQDALKNVFGSNDEQLKIASKIITQCITHLKGNISSSVRKSLQSKQFEHSEIGLTQEIRTFAKAFCQELMVVFGNQLLIILEKKGAKSEGKLSEEDQAELQALNDARERKKLLEPMLYQTFIEISQIFKSQVVDITQQIKEAKIYTWENKEQIKSFFDFISSLLEAENSINSICLMFSLMMSCHKPDIIWLDEISEALKNCAEGLNSYLIMQDILPYKSILQLAKVDNFGKHLRESLRAVTYSIGVISYRLIHLDKNESEEKKKLNKMNILQGGIESRFIPSLSVETKAQIEGSFKITNDKQLQSLALQSNDQVIIEAQDSLLNAIIHVEKSQTKIEKTLSILQFALVKNQPIIAKIGGDWGLKLSRAAFSVMIKFSDNIEHFMTLTQSIEQISTQIGDQDMQDILNKLISTCVVSWKALFKQWEQASQMRKWTQKVKLNLSEKIEKEEELKLRAQFTLNSTDPLDQEKQDSVRTKSDQRFDDEIKCKYQEVIKKAEFMIKLSIPAAFKEAKKEQMMKKVSKGILGKLKKNLDLFKNQSTISSNVGNNLSLSDNAQIKRTTTGMKKISRKELAPQRKNSLLFKETNIAQQDSEFDWRDRLRQWKQIQQTDGAVTSFEELTKQQYNSANFSVLGCLEASFSSEKLQETVEKSLVDGLRRSAGLHLLNFAMSLNCSYARFGDLIQWFQAALRDNRVQITHYLTGLEGCGAKAEMGIRQQFFQIINRVNHALQYHQEDPEDYVHLLNALCWNFTREDHQYLLDINVFKTLQCGDGTTQHPIFNAWGKEDTNFKLELKKEDSFSLSSRLSQVYEFLIQTVLETLFVKKEELRLDLGGEDGQHKMISRQDSVSTRPSELLLNSICDTLFANTNRYLSLKKLFKEGDDLPEHTDERFEQPQSENEFDSKIDRCLRDCAEQYNQHGGGEKGYLVFKIQRQTNLFKSSMLIQKIFEAGDNIQNDNSLVSVIMQIVSQSKIGTISLAKSIELIVSRDYRTEAIIEKMSMKQLNLEELELTVEEKCQLLDLTIEQYQEIFSDNLKQDQEEEKIPDSSQEPTSQTTTTIQDINSEPTQVPIQETVSQISEWNCSACTYLNDVSRTDCEMCTTAKPEQVATLIQDEIKKIPAEELQMSEDISEEEKSILKEKDPIKQHNKYLNFLSSIEPPAKPVDENSTQLKGTMFSETSLFRILKALDQLIALSEVSSEGYQIIRSFSNPENLKHIIQLSIESSITNQILIQKILQKIIRLDLPKDILDQSIKLASQPDNPNDEPNLLQQLLSKQGAVDFSESLFLKFLFNRLQMSRETLYDQHQAEVSGHNSVIQESMRTIRCLYTEADKNVELRKEVNQQILYSLVSIEDHSEAEIDAIMSLIYEAAFQRIEIGQPCINKEGKIFSVVGLLESSKQNEPYQQIPLYPNFNTKKQALSLAGLYFDPENLERQDLFKEKIYYCQPLLDLDEEQTIQAARLSIFMDPEALEQLILIAVQRDSSVRKTSAKINLHLLQSFIFRGISNMIRILKDEYVDFLTQFSDFQNFLQFLLGEVQLSEFGAENLISLNKLELKVNCLRDDVMTRNLSLQSLEEFHGDAISSEDGAQFILARAENPEDIFYFKTTMQIGEQAGKFFDGPVVNVDQDPLSNQDGIFVISSQKLNELTKNTLEILKSAKIVITDDGIDFHDFLPKLKVEIMKDVDNYKQCSQTCFKVLENFDDVMKISSIIQTDSPVKNTTATDRGFFLGMTLKHIDESIWDKIEKSDYIRKYVDINPKLSFTNVSTLHGPMIFNGLIMQNYREKDCDDVQNQVGETFQLIRSGGQPTAEQPSSSIDEITEENKKDDLANEENKEEQPKKQLQRIITSEKMVILDFEQILMETSEEVLNERVKSDFYNIQAREKYNAVEILAFNSHEIFAPVGEDFVKQYHSNIKQLKQKYSRQILLNILSTSSANFDDASKEFISQESTFQKICDMIHFEHMLASETSKDPESNILLLSSCKEQIISLLRQMKDVPKFATYFVTDFMTRASSTLEKFGDTDSYNKEKFIKFMLDSMPQDDCPRLLFPANLQFLLEQIFEQSYIQKEKLPEMLKSTFDLVIGYAQCFQYQKQYSICLSLLKFSRKILGQISDNLGLFVEKQNLMDTLFKSKLMQCLASHLTCENEVRDNTLRDRQKIVLELLSALAQLKERFKDDFNKDVCFGFKLNDGQKRAIKIFKIVEEGKQFKNFLKDQRFKAILQSSDSNKINHLARNYSTDDKKFVVKFYKEIQATEKDLIIKVDGHTSHDLIEIKKFSLPENRCANGHLLKIQIGSSCWRSGQGFCDRCRQSMTQEQADVGLERCDQCDYDVCRNCLPVQDPAAEQQIECTQTILADCGSLKSGKNLMMHLPQGTRATIEFPVRPQVVKFQGRLVCRDQDYEIYHDVWTNLDDTSQCCPVRVVSMQHSAMFVAADGNIWGMGYRAQGSGQEQCKLRKIDAPENMRNIKAVAHGKFFRLVVTEEGRIYYNGQSRRYMFGFGGSGNHSVECFKEMPNNFFRIDEGDKLVDVAGGKNFAIVMTERGKIYATGYMFWQYFSNCRHNNENNEDYPFELRLPEGYKAKKIFGSEKRYNMWVTAENQEGVTNSFGAGDSDTITGHNSSSTEFRKLDLPDGTYMKNITNQGTIVHGVDNNFNLWVWGSSYSSEAGEDYGILYEGQHVQESKPKKVKWFGDQNLKVLDAQGGYDRAIVKCENTDGKIVFYAMAKSPSDVDGIGSLSGVTSCFKHYISRLEVDGSRVKDFAMGRSAVYLLMGSNDEQQKSIDPDNPEAKGLIHFYQEKDDAGVKEWKFVTQEQYEDKKESLPDVCFATRHSIKKLIEQVSKMRDGTATDEDRNDTSFADLATIIPELQFNTEVNDHIQKTTNSASIIAKDQPLYYSHSTISGRDQKIYATESEAFSGNQVWDMNPLIFYRVKKPVDALDKLAQINLADHFEQAQENDSVSFTVMNKEINNDQISAIKITDQVTLDRFESFQKMTPEQDAEILKLIDQQISANESKVEDCKSSMFTVTKVNLKPSSSLEAIDEKVIQMRMSALFKFSKAFNRCIKYVSIDDRDVKGSISHTHFTSKNLVVSSVINQIVDTQLSDIPNGDYSEIRVNRRKAFEFQEEGNKDHEGKHSIFGQVCTQLRASCPDMSNFRTHELDGRCYKIKFLGEGSIDEGGPFRDSLVNIVQEMEEGVVPLLIKSPNNRNDHGTNRDCYLLDPSSNSPAHLEMYKYIGGFIAFGLLSKSPVPFNFAPTVWKQLLGERMNLADLQSIDAYSSQVLTDLQNHGASLSDADFEAGVDQNFTTILSNGDEIELCENGQERKVTKDSINEFVNLVIKARFNESIQQNKAIQEGLDKVLNGKFGLISYLTPAAIETRACGAKEIDMERLKSITTYPNCGSDHEIISRFWRVFESFTHEERSEYLKFVWGRNRLPVDLKQLSRKHEVRLTTSLNENGFPIAHTCFFQLDIPYYRSDEMCFKRLQQASQLCGSVDIDNNNFAEE